MILAVDNGPNAAMTSWGENCACHELLFSTFQFTGRGYVKASEYNKRKLLKKHFGKGYSTCPMAGKRLHELARGKVTDLLNSMFDMIDIALIRDAEASGNLPLIDEELLLLRSETERAKELMYAWMKLKLDYCTKLPWVLAGLSADREVDARECGRVLRATFDHDPRPPPVHHPFTWRLLEPGTPFRIALDQFLDDGVARRFASFYPEADCEIQIHACS